MRLAANGTELVITIEGYEFPDITDDWLMIRLDVLRPGAGWTKVDPGLLTWEVESLASWLESVAGWAPVTSLETRFMEPFLRFELLPQSWVLRVAADYGRLRMEVPAYPRVLAGCAASLRSQLRLYPGREPRRRKPDPPAG